MIRDWYLMGEIFTAIEKGSIDELIKSKNALAKNFEYPKGDILRHLKIMLDAGFIKGVDVFTYPDNRLGMYEHEPYITYQGYLFADAVVDKKLLSRTLNIIKNAGLVASFETIKYFTPISIKFFAECIKEG